MYRVPEPDSGAGPWVHAVIVAWPFSVRDALVGPPAARLRRALREAKRFLSETSARSLIDHIVAHPARRALLAGATLDSLHVGFLFPEPTLDLASLAETAVAAGFDGPHTSFPSTVVARELALLAGAEVPTHVFCAEAAPPVQRWVEVFIPALPQGSARGWLADEVSSHVGINLVDAAQLEPAGAALHAEGFAVPSFMTLTGIRNPALAVTGVYFDKREDDSLIRIELVRPEPACR